ncbi:MAG: lipid-A-disaccharide synthase [Lactobacillaceae bacterium]|nr:lipid-A-disaccharide synthase [Lactobacillaceae bacterium]
MDTNKPRIYLIAGEPSGDALGVRLMRALKRKTNGCVEFFGIGGDSMESEGLKSLFDISDLAIMGLAEVIPSIPKVLRRIKETVNDVVNKMPDIIITIDSWSFSSRVHKALRKKNLGIPQIHYVAPQVWAWKKKRAKTMYKYIDYLMTLLPQEPKYFTPHNLKATCVGHPVIESGIVSGKAEEFRKKFNIEKDKRIIALLPGSRHNEVQKLLPVFIESAKDLLKTDKNFVFVIPTVKTVSKRVRDMVEKNNLPAVIVEKEADRHNAFVASEAAVAASGTVALELAIVNVPHVIAYKVSPTTAFLARRFLKIEFVNLSNILLGREIIPELLQERAIPANINKYLKELLNKGDLYERQMEGFARVRELLGMGEQTPSETAGDIILDIIKENKKEV